MSARVEGIYIVRAGDTLSGIAKRELGSADRYSEIAAWNRHIRNPNFIYEGDFLFLPPPQRIRGLERVVLPSSAIADLNEASDYYKQMPYAHQEALSKHGESVGMIAGVMAEIDGKGSFQTVLTGTGTVRTVAYNVNFHIKTVGESFLRELDQLKAAYPNMKLNSSMLGKEVLKLQERANQELTRRIGETFRLQLSEGRFGTKALKNFVKGKNGIPDEITTAVKNTDEWMKRMKGVGTILVALDLIGSTYDCWKDFQDGTEDLRSCTESLGGFVGGTTVGVYGGAMLASLSLGGLPLLGGALLLAGLGVGTSMAGKYVSRRFYNAVN